MHSPSLTRRFTSNGIVCLIHRILKVYRGIGRSSELDFVAISGEFAVSNALSDFEVEHELCSANLPSIPHLSESAIDQALEALHLRGSNPAPEQMPAEPELPATSESKPISDQLSPDQLSPGLLPPEQLSPDQLPLDIPAPMKPRAFPRSAKRPKSKKSQRLLEALRSRRLRIIATAVGMLFVVGLIGMNWQRSGRSATSDDVAEMELAEFQDDLHFGSTGVSQGSVPRPLGDIADAEAASLKNQSFQLDSSERFPPLGLASHSEPAWPPSAIQTVGGISRPAPRGSQAAWLTGQIEVETLGTSRDESRRRSNGDAR